MLGTTARQMRTSHLVEGESTFDCIQATRTYIERYGKPVAFYSDKHLVFHVNERGIGGNGLTLYGRALQTKKARASQYWISEQDIYP